MATTRRSRCWRPASAGPRPDGSGSMCATTGRSAGRIRRRPPISIAPIAVASTRRRTWRGSPGSFRRTVMPGSRRSTIPRAPTLVRSPKWRAGRTAEGSSSTSGRRRSHQSRRRRSIGSPHSTSSRRGLSSPQPPSGWRTAPRRRRCSTRSSRGATRPWSRSRPSRRWPRRSATRPSGARRSRASSPMHGSKPTTTLPSAHCAALRCGVHCASLFQVSVNIASWFS